VNDETTLRPFSNGSSYIDWQERNCFRCAKYNHDDPPTCPLDVHLLVAYMGDGMIPVRVVEEFGGDLTSPWPLPLDCPKRQLKERSA
jgi:hypothetical protein